jgi:hypothetical protein
VKRIATFDLQTQLKVAFAGGGGADESRLLDEVFATWQ